MIFVFYATNVFLPPDGPCGGPGGGASGQNKENNVMIGANVANAHFLEIKFLHDLYRTFLK